MRKRAGGRNWKRRSNIHKALSVIFSVILPPLGIFYTWRSRWSNTAKYCLTGLAVGCMVLMVALLPSADGRVNGGIELVGRKPEAQIYGPDLPTATVTGYIAPLSQSIFVQEDDGETTYVYATTEGSCYHLSGCTYAFASAQKMTPYQAYYMGYSPCTICNAPAYVPGTIQ